MEAANSALPSALRGPNPKGTYKFSACAHHHKNATKLKVQVLDPITQFCYNLIKGNYVLMMLGGYRLL